MKAKLTELEQLLEKYSTRSALPREFVTNFPSDLQQVHSYKIFGDNLLAIPANLIIPGDDEEFEHPFTFTDSEETLRIFESEYRDEITKEFVQIGWLTRTQVVLLNTISEAIHIFNVQDVADKKWLNYKLQRQVCTFQMFIERLRVQTVCCFLNPENYSQFDIFEIRDGLELKTDSGTTTFTSIELLIKEYFNLVNQSLAKGYKLHYAPQHVMDAVVK